MITLTYTPEMEKQDNLWQMEKEDLNVMEELYHQLIAEAKSKGFKGIVTIYEANGEMVSEVYESEEEYKLVENGELDLQGENMSGCCKPLLEKIEAVLNK